jgi:hypothetical protein
VECFLSFIDGYNSKEIYFSSFPVNDFRLYAHVLSRKKLPIHTVFETMEYVVFVDQKVQPTNHQRKTMITLFSVVRESPSRTLCHGPEVNFGALPRRSHSPTRDRKISDKEGPKTPRSRSHFDNAPVHNTEKVERTLQECEFKRRGHPPYIQDLSAYNFYFCNYLCEKMKLLFEYTFWTSQNQTIEY